MWLFSGRGLGEIERRVLNVMVDRLNVIQIARRTDLSEEQVKGALVRLEKRQLVSSMRNSAAQEWLITYAGKRVAG